MYNSLQMIVPSTLPFGIISIHSESIVPTKLPLTITLFAMIFPFTTPLLPTKIVFVELILPSNSPSMWIWHSIFNSPLNLVFAAIIVAPLEFGASNCLLSLVKIAMLHFSPC